MSNPFDYIRQEREKREAEDIEKRQKQEEGKKARALREVEEQKRIFDLKQKAMNEYDELVTKTLELLLQVIVTDLPTRTIDWLSEWKVARHGDMSWSIGHMETIHGTSGWEENPWHRDEWLWEVQVTLVLDSTYKPIGFNADKHSRIFRDQRGDVVRKPVEADLSQTRLIEALKALYPSINVS